MTNPSPDAGRGVRGSVVILGADACLAALPATPTQLVNACVAFGYDDVIPASWGDELLAVGCLDQLAARGDQPAMACICPLVREQLRGTTGLGDAAVRLVSPPVAAALYLRATAGADQRITYVGDCPGAGHPSIDIHLSPAQFLTLLAERGIVPGAQRPVSNDPGRVVRDRRRHYSLPGGVPAPQWLASEGIERTLVDLGDLASLDPAAHGGRTLVDLAPRLGCVCSGALAGCSAADARSAVMLHEPPRSTEEVVDHAVIVSVADGTPARTMPHAGEVSWPQFVSSLGAVWGGGAMAPARPVPVARAAVPAPAAGAPRAPVHRPRVPKRLGDEGQIVPRAYQARRPPRPAAAPPAAAPRDDRLTTTPPYGPAWAARRPTPASVPRTTGVREVRTRLASADRWLLASLVVGGSLLVASLTSVLTVRGLRGSLDAAPVAAAPVRPDTVVVASAPRESVPERVAAVPPPVAAETSAAPDPGGAARALADAPPQAARSASAAARSARARAVPARPRPTPVEHRTLVADRPRSPATHVPNAVPRAAASPVAAVPAATTGTTAVPAQQTPVQSAPTTAPQTATPAATAVPVVHDSAAATNAQVLEELRSIRNEIEARKKHVDSLTHALDSLKKTDPSR
ncbi:MAG TPA: hypothetical protein VIC24_15180 [Gemmatimonadaceae bacterium]|jgi:hypothetical protein